MSSKMAINVVVAIDDKDANPRLKELQAQLEELSNKTIGLDIGDAEAKAKIKELKVELEELATQHPDIKVKVAADRALAVLAAIKLASEEVNGKQIKLNVDDGGSANKSKGDINALMTAGIALGPAIIPVAAAVTAALAAIGTGAALGIAGIATGMLAFHGISQAVTELGTAQQGAAAKAAQNASQQISSANSIASAHDALANAIQNVGITEANVDDSIISAKERLATATTNVLVVTQNAAHSISMALRQEASSEQSLEVAQHSEDLAQKSLTQSRIDAQRALQQMSFSVTDNALAQQRATLDLQVAQRNLSNISAADPRYASAALTVQEDQQRLLELQNTGKNLAQDKATADAKGVDGSKGVVSAQDALALAQQRVVAAQHQVEDSAYAATKAQEDGARSVAAAQRAEGDASRALTKAEVDGANQIGNAKQAVVSATRSLQNAEASAAAQAAATTAANASLLKSYNLLSPAGKQFADFIHGDLEPKLRALQATAQQGMLPGVESGLKAVEANLPQLNSLVDVTAHALGNLADRAGHALNDPFWRGFIDFIKGEAGPSFQILGNVMGNLAQGAATMVMAFKPVWDQMGAGVDGLSAKFANWSKGLGGNPEFQRFLDYVKTNGPKVMDLIGQLFVMFSRLGEALGPLGGLLLTVVDGFVRIINMIPTPVLGPLVDVLWLGFTAWKAWLIIDSVRVALVAMKDAQIVATVVQWAWNAAIYANPIFWVVGALIILGLGIYEVVKHWQFFKDVGEAAWHGIQTAARWCWDNVLSPVFNWIGAGIQHIKDAFNSLPDVVRQAFTMVRIFATDPISFVIRYVYNDGIVPVWNGIAGVFGLGRLSPVPGYATGGVLPGYAPGVDSVHALLSPGEGVLVPEAVKALGPGFVHWANREFSGGRAVGSTGNAYAGGGIVGDVAGMFTNPVGALHALFGDVLGTAGRTPFGPVPPSMLHDALVSLPMHVIDAAVAKAKAYIETMFSAGAAGGGGAVGAGVEQWTGMVMNALGIMHQDPGNLHATLRRMNQESGGNPTAVNRSDINWQHGTPSVGLMQVIGPTYAHNKVIDAGPYMYGVSIDPLANTLASMRYAVGQYGSLASAYNRAGGYANGGIVTSPTLAHVGESGPEAILPLNRPDRARQVMAQAGIGSPVHIGTVHVHDGVDLDLLTHKLAFAAKAASF